MLSRQKYGEGNWWKDRWTADVAISACSDIVIVSVIQGCAEGGAAYRRVQVILAVALIRGASLAVQALPCIS
jgi:hypothetical protein